MTELFESKISVQFVLNVLRQHEIELDKTVAELSVLENKFEKLVAKVESLIEKEAK